MSDASEMVMIGYNMASTYKSIQSLENFSRRFMGH